MKKFPEEDGYSELILKSASLTVFALGIFCLTQYVVAGRLYAFSDFSAFYIAGEMALEGRTAESYDLQSYQDFYKEYFAREKSGYGWFYPPHFLLPLSLLAELPRVTAKFVWLTATYAIYLFGMSKLIQRPVEWIFVLFLPAAIINLHAAQTGFLVTGLLALYLSYAESSKVTTKASAGLALALLTFKPHLWITLPLLVLLRRQFIVLLACMVFLLALFLASIILFGQEAWWAMFSSVIGGYGEIHDDQILLRNKMSTIVILASEFGLNDIKLLVQLSILAVSTSIIIWTKTKVGNDDILTAFAIVSAFVVAPHNMVYDHTILIIPCLLVMRPENAIPKWVISVCGVVYFFPYVPIVTDALEYFPFGAVVVLLFWFCLLVLAIRSTTRSVSSANNSLSSSQLAHPKAFLSVSTQGKQGR